MGIDELSAIEFRSDEIPLMKSFLATSGLTQLLPDAVFPFSVPPVSAHPFFLSTFGDDSLSRPDSKHADACIRANWELISILRI